jgi:hypothetical protein
MIAEGTQSPFAIESLGEQLDVGRLPRARVYFGVLGDILEGIAQNVPNMRWWVSDKGLNMAIVPPEEMLPTFDAIAAELCNRIWTTPKLSKTDLQLIALELDQKTATMAGEFLDRFPPSARAILAEYNQKNARVAIKTFATAAANPRFAGLFRRRLYRARERLAKAKAAGF